MHSNRRMRCAGYLVAIVAWLGCSALALGQDDDDQTLLADSQPAPVEIELIKDIVYGTGGGENLLLDLASPKGLTQPTPTIVWIHGGAWRGGKKDEFERLIQESARQGFVAVSINYRLVPKHVFPAQIEDCKCAVRWLRAHHEKLHVDPERIGVVGSSAGAHLAMLLGAMDSADGLEGQGGWADASSRVRCVVSFAGPTNLQAEFPEASRGLVADFLGGASSNKPDVAKAASPVTYVSKDDPPMLLFQGTTDPLVPHAQAIEMAETLTKAGVGGRVEILVGEGHGWPSQHERVLRATFAFLKQQLQTPRNGK